MTFRLKQKRTHPLTVGIPIALGNSPRPLIISCWWSVFHPIHAKDHAHTDPNQLIQQLSKSGKGREVLEMLEEALKESDPADLEEDAKYTRRDSNPQPSVPKTDALSS